MSQGKLSTRIFWAAGLTLLLFSLTSFLVLYRAQIRLATAEMDQVLQSRAFLLSSLVNAQPGGKLEFDFSPLIYNQYQHSKTAGFFRIFVVGNARPVRESLNAPALACEPSPTAKLARKSLNGRDFRVLYTTFRPEADEPVRNRATFKRPRLCLVTGLDEAPYRNLVMDSTWATIPIQISVLILFFALFLTLMWKLTSDLARLNAALNSADFGATHSFPKLPRATTTEVRVVNEKLELLHRQAAEYYKETWLFLGRAAHQLKTPVTALQATLDVLLRKERSKEELRTGLQEVQAGVIQMGKLTQKLLASSRMAYSPDLLEGQQQSSNLGEFLKTQINLFQKQADLRHVTWEYSPPDQIRVSGSETLLNELFSNLLENAVLYTRENSRIRIDLIHSETEAVVSIQDQGPGFSPGVMERLFQPFVRGDERMGVGSGLGLSIADRAAHLLKGSIRIVDTGPRGSRIEVRLPRMGDSMTSV